MRVAAQRDHRADRHALADLELRDRLLGAGHDRLLAGDARDLVGAGVDDLGVLVASPRPMLTTTFSIFGIAITFL